MSFSKRPSAYCVALYYIQTTTKVRLGQDIRKETDADALKTRLKKQCQSTQSLKDAKKALFERFTSGIIDAVVYKIEKMELSRQLTDAEQTVIELENAIAQTKRRQQTHTQTNADTMEFRDDMMGCVNGIKVFSTTHAVVEVNVSHLLVPKTSL